MKSRQAIASLVAALALSAAIAGPTLAAPPTYSGSVFCTFANIENYELLDYPPGTTGAQIRVDKKRFTGKTGSCAKGTWDGSQLEKDPRT